MFVCLCACVVGVVGLFAPVCVIACSRVVCLCDGLVACLRAWLIASLFVCLFRWLSDLLSG